MKSSYLIYPNNTSQSSEAIAKDTDATKPRSLAEHCSAFHNAENMEHITKETTINLQDLGVQSLDRYTSQYSTRQKAKDMLNARFKTTITHLTSLLNDLKLDSQEASCLHPKWLTTDLLVLHIRNDCHVLHSPTKVLPFARQGKIDHFNAR